MSERDGFGSGFVLGTVVGGLVGGLVGALVASRQQPTAEEETMLVEAEGEPGSIEGARRSLEAKIAQLNSAIDEVRQQLGSVNGNGSELEREYRE